MLNRSSNTTLERSIQPHGSVGHARKHTTHYAEVPAGFPALFEVDEEENSREENPELSPEQSESLAAETSGAPEIFQLIFNDNFQEMLQRFLIPGHEHALQLRAELYRRHAERLPGEALLIRHTVKLESLRDQLYRMQSHLFAHPENPVGQWIA